MCWSNVTVSKKMTELDVLHDCWGLLMRQMAAPLADEQLEYGVTQSRGKIGDHTQLEYKDATRRKRHS